jgi:hypothetical protein
VAIVLSALGVTLLGHVAPGFHVATIGSRFHTVIDGRDVAGIPQVPPMPMLPWGHDGMTFGKVRELLGPALAIAMLGAIESLLSAVIADAMTGKKHDPNAELVGLGLGNIVAPFFGGIAATGALARTATNIRAGATSPIAAVVHSLTVLAAVLVLAPLVAYVPMAALSALLLLVAWNMSDVRHFVHTVRVAPRSDVAVLLTCFFLTVVFDMVVAISVGVVLAALLFMKRMSEMTSSRVVGTGDTRDETRTLPPGVVLYEIAGPLFFGAAQRAMVALDTVGVGARVGAGHRRHGSGRTGKRARAASAVEEARRHRGPAPRASQRLSEGQPRGRPRARVPRRHARRGRSARPRPRAAHAGRGPSVGAHPNHCVAAVGGRGHLGYVATCAWARVHVRPSSALYRARGTRHAASTLLEHILDERVSIEVEPCPASGMVEPSAGTRHRTHASQDARWGNGRDQGEAAPGRGHGRWRQWKQARRRHAGARVGPGP